MTHQIRLKHSRKKSSSSVPEIELTYQHSQPHPSKRMRLDHSNSSSSSSRRRHQPDSSHHHQSNQEPEPMEIEEDLNPSHSNLNKRQRGTSPDSDQRSKRSRSSNYEHPSDPESSSLNRTKPYSHLSSARNSIKSQSKSISSRSASMELNLPNFVPGVPTSALYAEKVGRADRFRVAGNNLYQEKNYTGAVQLYTKAIQAYPVEYQPHQQAHPGITTSLANRASAYMALKEFTPAAADLLQSLKSTHLPVWLSDSLRSTLGKRVLRLVKCQLALLKPIEANEAIEHLSKPTSSVFIDYLHPLYPEMSSLISRINMLKEAVGCVERSKLLANWTMLADAIASIEKMWMGWGYVHSNSNSPQKLPEVLICWKAEVKARMGDGSGAYEIFLQCTQAGELPEYDRERVQGLIHFAQAKFEQAVLSFDRSLASHEDSSLGQIRSRAQVLKNAWTRIKNMDRADHNQVIKSAEQLLEHSFDKMERLFRVELRLIVCEALVFQQQANRKQPIQNHKLQAMLSHIFADLDYNFERRQQLETEYRTYVIRALLSQARFNNASSNTKLAQQDYQKISKLLKEDQWATGLKIDVAAVIREVERECNNSSRNSSTGRNSSRRSSPPRQAPPPRPKVSARDPKGYYAILEVSHTVTPSELKRSYRALCRRLHPDKGGATNVFQQLQEAFETLSDPSKRRSYDRHY
ncbi:uncharacterized protein MELLADRAFT_79446 [Melampsora larici-populina 98AG31]|uniref:J domain-containing protein n=1 Tax=Melampsora larici-populina (strain 98AG31 / pathotype 3-4-7) TaxID=747676 RepID=F4S709_MELLP|nr:uncharacterized protein MELLADRAFT_79446 [Melampsora larici-populina 98AG31]EGF99589.1 hypothetical protein MELLADRAFT_79446 [Melampsora larici-populina 98AG31]